MIEWRTWLGLPCTEASVLRVKRLPEVGHDRKSAERTPRHCQWGVAQGCHVSDDLEEASGQGYACGCAAAAAVVVVVVGGCGCGCVLWWL